MSHEQKPGIYFLHVITFEEKLHGGLKNSKLKAGASRSI
jgi:hypothetical protein